MSKQKNPSSAQAETVEQLRPEPEEVPGRDLPTVDELAAQLPPDTLVGLVAAAACLHGWVEHKHATGEPMRMSAADFDAALKTTLKPGKASPHTPAASKYRAKIGS